MKKLQNNLHLKAKTRFVDPAVRTERGTKKLSAIDPAYRRQLTAAIAQRRGGIYVKISL